MFSGNESNPLTPSFVTPGITYNIGVTFDSSGNPTLSGSHDAFPSYEVLVDGRVIYSHQETIPFGLFPAYPDVIIGN